MLDVFDFIRLLNGFMDLMVCGACTSKRNHMVSKVSCLDLHTV